MEVIVVIPARYDSSRFAGKVLANDTGRFLVQHTYEQALKAKNVSSVMIATDSDKVMAACNSFGARCVMTSVEHQSGTDRIAEAVADIGADIIVNVQADEPEIDPEHIDKLVGLLKEQTDADMATLVTGFESIEQVSNPNVVKCIVDRAGRAIYFSRSVIPYCRDAAGVGELSIYSRHLGIYAYRRKFLLEITQKPRTSLEINESLERLRAIEYGYKIAVAKVAHSCEGIDTAKQYAEFVKRIVN